MKRAVWVLFLVEGNALDAYIKTVPYFLFVFLSLKFVC